MTKIMKIKMEKNRFEENGLILLVILFEIIGMIISSSIFMICIALIAVISIFKSYYKLKKINNLLLSIFFAFLIFSFIISNIHNHNVNYNGLIYNIILFPITILMLNTKIKLNMMKFIYWIYTFYLGICVCLNIDPNNFFETSSRNYVSVVYIYLLCILIFSEKNKSEKISYIYFIIPIFFSVLALGRGGILCTILFFWGRLFVDLIYEKNIYKKMLTVFFIFVSSIISFLLLLYASNLLSRIFSRFINEGFHDNARHTIWYRYYELASSDIWDIFLGASINDDRYLEKQVAGNLHNSFLSMHSRFGFLFLLFNIFLLLKACLFYMKKRKYDYILALFIFLLRGMTDILFATFWGDIIWWYFLFFPYFYNNSLNIKTKKHSQ